MHRIIIPLSAILLLAVSARAADDTIKMGVSVPLTGEIASYGEDVKAGIELAVADVNAKGGVLGKKLQPLFEDDAGDPKLAVTIANRMLGEHIAVAINGVSRTSMPTAPIFAEENIPFFVQASTDLITSHGWTNIARIIPKNGMEAPKLAALIGKYAASHKLAMLYASEEYSSNLTETTLPLLAQSKIVPDMVMKMSDKDQDYSAVISRLKDQKIDVVFLGFWPKAVGAFLRQAVAARYRPVFIGDSVASLDEVIKIAGKDANGLMFTMYPDPQLHASAQPVVKALADKHIIGHPLAVYAYLVGQIYADAVQKAGSTEGAKVMKAVKSGTFKTIMGDMQGIDFDYYKWQDGKIVPLK